MIKKKDLSQEDKIVWEKYTQNPSNIYDKEKDVSFNVPRKNRYKFDLHGFTLQEANTKIRELIFFCVKNKYKEIILITGKGLHSTSDKDSYVSKDFSKLKFSVPEFIKTNNELNELVISISVANPKDGGEGAVLIRLKNL